MEAITESEAPRTPTAYPCRTASSHPATAHEVIVIVSAEYATTQIGPRQHCKNVGDRALGALQESF